MVEEVQVTPAPALPPAGYAGSNPPPAAGAAMPRPVRSGGGGVGFAVLLSLVAVGISAYAFYRAYSGEQLRDERFEAAETDARSRDERIAGLTRDLSNATAAQRELERKLTDAGDTNRSLREELLGLGERASLLEDAMTSLAERSLGGAMALKLNEAEFLLRMGVERLRLFGDVDAALDAYRLADAQLAELDDPVLTGVRQTLAAEIGALAEAPRVPLTDALQQVDTVIDALATLPSRVTPLIAANPEPDAGMADRLGSVLAQFVRIRRVDGSGSELINPLHADAIRAAALLELTLAKAALAAHDGPRAAGALDRARQRIAAGFAPDAAAVTQTLATLDTLRVETLALATPETGRALAELVNLRATRALGRDAAPNADLPIPLPAAAEPPPASDAADPAVSPAPNESAPNESVPNESAPNEVRPPEVVAPGTDAICVASLMRCDSPPLSVREGRLSVR